MIKTIVVIIVLVFGLSGLDDGLLATKTPRQICQERCDKQYSECVNSAYEWYFRCRDYYEEMQCRERLNFMLGLCYREWSYCMEAC